MSEETDTLTPKDSPSADAACYAPDRRPWWKRFLSRFFQWHDCLPELPPWARDGIVVVVNTNFSWKDRLRIALTGNVSMKAFVACENVPGRTSSQASVVCPLECA